MPTCFDIFCLICAQNVVLQSCPKTAQDIPRPQDPKIPQARSTNQPAQTHQGVFGLKPVHSSVASNGATATTTTTNAWGWHFNRGSVWVKDAIWVRVRKPLHHKVYQNAGVFCWCRFCCCKPAWNKIVWILSTITATAGELRPNSFQLFGFTLLWRWWTMMDDDGQWWMMDDCTVPQAAVRLKPALRLILIHPGQTSLGNTCCELTFLTVTGILSAAASRSLHQGYRRVRGFRHVTWSSYCGSKL